MDYYGLLIHCYVEINDTENAEKYYEMIKKEAPDYYFLSKLKMLIKIKK